MSSNLEKKTVQKLIDYLGITRPDLVRYANCYNIDLNSFCIKPQFYFATYLEIYDDTFEFFLSKKEEIKKFNFEFFRPKTVKQLCDALDLTLNQFNDFYNFHITRLLHFSPTQPSPRFDKAVSLEVNREFSLEENIYHISSQYLLHLKNGFPLKTFRNMSSMKDISNQSSKFGLIIGYEDFKETIIDLLNPIVDGKALDDWGLRKPGGIILFGPPGCGKTFWAFQIADYLKYEFIEIPRSVFASSYVDGAVKNLKELLDKIESRTVIFFDEFDSVAETRSSSSSSSKENTKVVNTLLQEIPKLIERDIMIIAATNYLDRIDSAVIRPGRFDLKIPIFPPNKTERAKIIYQNLTSNIKYSSPLNQILTRNNINTFEYFLESSEDMKLFSSSLIEDFVDTLRRKLKNSYDSGKSIDEILVDKILIDDIISVTSAKIVNQDLEILANFYLEVDSFVGSTLYQARLETLKQELAIKYKKEKNPPKPIGFRMPNIEK
ncbi:MAG TPA: ATP-binding protein [Saprospiraceae bacterium]|nr:ATP-binding protein [Saprospiraceae bacterium]